MKKPQPQYPIDKRVAHRLARLEALIDSEYGGSAAAFEARTGIKMTQVSQWFTGYRALRDKALARLEAQTGKPDGWFDEVPESYWPFSEELQYAVAQLEEDEIDRVENVIRATVGIPLLSRVGELHIDTPHTTVHTNSSSSSVGRRLTSVDLPKSGAVVFKSPPAPQGVKHGRDKARGTPRK